MKLHLPKALFTAVLAAFAVSQTSWAETTHEVWANFGCIRVDSSSVPEGMNMPTGALWNNVTQSEGDPANADACNPHYNATGTYTLSDTNGSAVASLDLWVNANCWGPGNDSGSVLDQMQASYLDLNGSQTWTMKLFIDDVSAEDVNLTLYFSGDSGKYDPISVNGTTYIGGTDTKGSTVWGERQHTTTMDANNTITVTDVGSGIRMTNITNGGRATISGMSLSYTTTGDVYTATLTAGSNDATTLSYTLGETTATWATLNPAENYVAVNGADDNTSTYALAGGSTLKGFQVNSNTVALSSDGAVTIGKLWAKSGSTLNLGATLTAGSDVTFGGAGTINMNISQSLGNATLLGALNLADGTTLNLSGSNSIFSASATLTGNGKINLSQDAAISATKINATDLLARAEGTGTIDISGGGEYNIVGNAVHTGSGQAISTNPTITQYDFAGTIAMASDTKLVLGDKRTGGYDHLGWALGFDDATIQLNGGGLRFNGHYSTIGTLDIEKTDALHIQDTYSKTDTGLTIKKLNLDAGLTMTATWKAVVNIQTLQGTGALTIGETSDSVWKINIDQVTSSGAININHGTATVQLGKEASSTVCLGGDITNAGTLNILGALSGTSTINGGTINVLGGTTVAGDITFDTAITLGGTLQNTGSLTLKGNVTVDVGSLKASTDSTVTYSENDGKDGFIASAQYYIAESTGSGTATVDAGLTVNGIYDMEASGNHIVINVEEANTSGKYYVNTQDFTVDGSETNVAKNASGYVVAKDQGLIIQDDQSETVSAAQILASTTGAGNITVDMAEITLDDGSTQAKEITLDDVSTQAKGTLTINKDKRLNVGNGTNDTATISSFNAVELKGGTLDLNGAGSSINNLTVNTDASTLSTRNVGRGHQDYQLLGTTTLNADLKLTAFDGEHGNVIIKNLTGTKNLSVEHTGYWGVIKAKIEKMTDYSGTITVSKSDLTTSYNNSVEFGVEDKSVTTAAFTTLTGLELKANSTGLVHAKADSTITNTTLENGSLYYRTDYGAYKQTLTNLTVGGTSKVAIEGAGEGQGNFYEGHVVIGNLTNATTDAATLVLESNFRNSKANLFELNGGSFKGTIELKATSSGNRPHALNINNGTVAQNAEIKLTNNDSTAHTMALGIGADKVTVKSLSGGDGAAIYSGAQAFQSTSFASSASTTSEDGKRTLEIATDDATYTTTAAIKSGINLVKSGSGTQNLGGDMSDFDGSVEVTGGTLAQTKADTTVSISKLTVSNGATYTAAGDTSIDALVLSSGLSEDKAAVSATGALTLGTVSLDLTGYEAGTYTLATTTGTLTYNLGEIDWKNLAEGLQAEVSFMAMNTLAATSEAGGTLVLTLTAQPTVDALTSLTVNGLVGYADGVLTLKTEEATVGAVFDSQKDVNVTMSDADWDAILAALKVEGTTLPSEIALKFQGSDGEYFDFNGTAVTDDSGMPAITINKEIVRGEYTGPNDGTIVGNYVTAYIPEPTTTTLSLLALAGLAVRRRRASR